MRSLIKFYFLAWPLVCAFFVLFFFFGQHSRRTVVINICICLDCINLLNLHHVAESIYGPTVGSFSYIYVQKGVYDIYTHIYVPPHVPPSLWSRAVCLPAALCLFLLSAVCLPCQLVCLLLWRMFRLPPFVIPPKPCRPPQPTPLRKALIAAAFAADLALSESELPGKYLWGHSRLVSAAGQNIWAAKIYGPENSTRVANPIDTLCVNRVRYLGNFTNCLLLEEKEMQP